jgi:Arc/MetJ-type ribon-helix-helix transcriptional regulator
VNSVNVTVRFGEDELRRLDELAQRMGRTRSDVIRDLIARFDEMLREEVEKERRRWMMIGFVAALESEILDPEVVLRFVRRNVDVLGFPDFIIGMVRVRNRVVLFSHHDKIGSQLLSLVRSRIEDEVRREEAEIEREEDEDSEGGGATPVRIRVSRPIKPSAPHAVPGPHRYKILVSSRNALPAARPTAVAAAGRPGGGGSGGAETTANASVAENQKLASTGLPIAGDSTGLQTRNPNSQATTNGGGLVLARPVGQGANHGPAGDFIMALITNLYHKRRESLLRFIEGMAGG